MRCRGRACDAEGIVSGYRGIVERRSVAAASGLQLEAGGMHHAVSFVNDPGWRLGCCNFGPKSSPLE